ncbi:hypothetical protein [uncultured Sanguibacteroides sp.]|uniref:golvesin C-terminal-like domain-containing protein n=1 Tax=uncultured Sanguibacteroides sp. TaxID=1635151 RepID=UPI0025D08A46|nr:hypothetical protein [uncultured Sanguibacteroides sp.]
MNLYNVNTILTHEAKIQGRSILFKILVGLVIGGITYIVMIYQGNFHPVSWQKIAMPSYIPWISTTLLNLIQNLFIIFRVSGFYKRWTAENLEVHQASNSEWMTGKVLGVIKVLFILDFASIGITSLVHILLTGSPFNIGIYLFYFSTLTIPSTLFYTGFTLLLSFLTRHKGITVLIAGIFYLFTSGIFHDYWNGTTDVLAISIPNIFSNITGHVNTGYYLMHQGAFLLLGIGIIGLASARFNRIPNRVKAPGRTCLAGGIVTLVGITLLASYRIHFVKESQKRQNHVEIFVRHGNIPNLQIPEHQIHFSREGSTVNATSEFYLKNPNPGKVDTLVLFLNPGLKINSLKENGKELPFKQEGQITLIFHPLETGQEIKLKLRYSGEIDESVAYLDIPDKLFYKPKDNPFLPFVLGKRTAIVEKDFIFLTPEVMWYPTAVPPVNPLAPFCSGKDFTRFNLVIEKPGKLVFLSQGKEEKNKKQVSFDNEEPLTGISLCAGKFRKKNINMGKFNAYLYHLEDQPFFYQDLKLANIRLIMEDYKNLINYRGINGNPPYKLMLIETPLSISSFFRPWKKSSDFAQPEIFFWPERGATFDLDLKQMKKIYRKSFYTNDEKELQSHMLSRSLELLVQGEFSHYNEKTGIANWEKNKYNILPVLVKDTCYTRSDEFPIMNTIVKNILEEDPRFSSDQMIPSLNTILALRYMEKHSLKEALYDKALPEEVLAKIIDLKKKDFLHYLASCARRDQVIDLLRKTCTTPHQVTFFEEFSERFKEKFNTDILPFTHRWYTGKGLPAILVQEVRKGKIEGDKLERYAAHVKLYNPSDIDATIYVSFEADQRLHTTLSSPAIKYLVIPARSCKLVKMVNDNKYNIYLYMGISQNIPNQKQLGAPLVTITDTTTGIFDCEPTVTTPNPDELIVDNEGQGFSLVEPGQKLSNLFKQEFERYYEWPHNALKWTKNYNSTYYGEIIKSIYYKAGGKGNYKAKWEVNITEPGEYEIFAHIPLIYTVQPPVLNNYCDGAILHYTIEQREKQEVKLDIMRKRERRIGFWIPLGTFTLEAGKTSVTLDDRGSSNQYIVADAIKWVKKKTSTDK